MTWSMFCKDYFLSIYFTIQFIFTIIYGFIELFGIIYGFYCTISTNFYLYLQYFQQNKRIPNRPYGSIWDPLIWQKLKSQLILLFILFLLLFMGLIALFGTIYESNCTISSNCILSTVLSAKKIQFQQNKRIPNRSVKRGP